MRAVAGAKTRLRPGRPELLSGQGPAELVKGPQHKALRDHAFVELLEGTGLPPDLRCNRASPKSASFQAVRAARPRSAISFHRTKEESSSCHHLPSPCGAVGGVGRDLAAGSKAAASSPRPVGSWNGHGAARRRWLLASQARASSSGAARRRGCGSAVPVAQRRRWATANSTPRERLAARTPGRHIARVTTYSYRNGIPTIR